MKGVGRGALGGDLNMIWGAIMIWSARQKKILKERASEWVKERNLKENLKSVNLKSASEAVEIIKLKENLNVKKSLYSLNT